MNNYLGRWKRVRVQIVPQQGEIRHGLPSHVNLKFAA